MNILSASGLSIGRRFIPGDFFETVPSIADAIILKSVIHDWNDERSSMILRNCRKALPENGTLLLVERIMPEQPTESDVDKAHAMSDLNMLRGPGGCERTEQQYCLLLEQSGFQSNVGSFGRSLQRHRSTRLLIAIQRTSLSAHTAFGCSLNGHFAPEADIPEMSSL